MSTNPEGLEQSASISREIRAIYDADTIRVYQAYNEEIADSAVCANSFRGPLEAGLWSKTRMTWIKPSKVWMAYRCGWTVLKDDNQARVLALDLSRARFEELLARATVATHGKKSKTNRGSRKPSVVVQWDPERYMAVGEEAQVYTRFDRSVRSIQIGLRGLAVEALLDDELVKKITDVTEDYRSALAALQGGDLLQAERDLWPGTERERVMDIPQGLREALMMSACPPKGPKKAIVVLGSAANPPHPGHLHCLKVGKKWAEEQGYDVMCTTVAIAPFAYVKRKMASSSSPLILSDDSRLELLRMLTVGGGGDYHHGIAPFRCPDCSYGSALECGTSMRPSEDVAVVIVVGGDRAKRKWRKQPRARHLTVCCARDKAQHDTLRQSFAEDQNEDLVLDGNYHITLGVGPPTSSTVIRDILLAKEQSMEDKAFELESHGYSSEAAKFFLEKCLRDC